MNSSDWIAAATAGDGEQHLPDWLAAMQTTGEFSDMSPFSRKRDGASPAEKASPLSEPEPAQQQTEYDRGFVAGDAAGRAAAHAEMAAEKDQRTALRLAFRELDQAAMDTLASELADTVMALCDAALEKHAADPEALIERAREAARRLGLAAASCTLHLHPDDIETLDKGALSGWQIEADPTLQRGSIALVGEEGGVRDGPAEWRRAIAAALRG
ncbi:FliH/SctL family protein [Erythrobacter sp. YT30]|uniref:FliH/SctL family protein n=1 Tax=Erythrobacter sp. YT30 TaxID=1735012 RepID=UPI0018D1F88A|nr:FliH/SctL family protein [Erythrobacter sp. YT30]